MKLYHSLFLTLGIISCTPKSDLIRCWKADHYSFAEKAHAYLDGTRVLATGTELTLHPDSTYTKIDGSLFISGKWTVYGDTLKLVADPLGLKKMKPDSMNNTLYFATRPHESFHIKRNRLVQYTKGNYCRKRKKDGTIHMKEHFRLEILK